MNVAEHSQNIISRYTAISRYIELRYIIIIIIISDRAHIDLSHAVRWTPVSPAA